VRTIFASAMVVLVASSSQPTCNDTEVLQELVTKYFGLGEYKGMTDAEIRDKIIIAPEMQHWRDIAKENEVGEAIANWVIDIDVQAIISARYLVKSITVLPTSYEPNSKMYTCQATFNFDNEKLNPYLTLVTLNSWLRLEDFVHDLNVGVVMNNMEKWHAVEQSLDLRLRQIAERITSCVRKQVSFTVQPSYSGFSTDFDSKPAIDQVCLVSPSK
jgi:hypothetical protein